MIPGLLAGWRNERKNNPDASAKARVARFGSGTDSHAKVGRAETATGERRTSRVQTRPECFILLLLWLHSHQYAVLPALYMNRNACLDVSETHVYRQISGCHTSQSHHSQRHTAVHTRQQHHLKTQGMQKAKLPSHRDSLTQML